MCALRRTFSDELIFFASRWFTIPTGYFIIALCPANYSGGIVIENNDMYRLGSSTGFTHDGLMRSVNNISGGRVDKCSLAR